jgi:myo-inositol-1(or 4)-monophosphatase
MDGHLPPAVARVVDAALAALLPELDALREGTLSRSGRTAHVVKDDGTPVTPTDIAVDERLVAMVADRFPDHDVVSEEVDPTADDAVWHWVVDPVDGTSNFAAGLPYWAVSVALCHAGRPVLGVIDAPDLGSRWIAVAGRGTTRDGTPVRTRSVPSLAEADGAHLPLLSTLGTLARARFDGGIRLNPRVLGATCLDHTLVADGVAAGAMSLAPKLWDVAAAALLVEEAGGATLTFGDRGPLFPVQPGTDYSVAAAPAFSSTTPATAHELVVRTTPIEGWPARVVERDVLDA